MRAPEKSHFVCAVIWRRDERGQIKFLVVDSVSTHPRTGNKSGVNVKFPGGMNRTGESIEETFQREVLEETNLSVLSSDAELIWSFDASRDHTRYAFLIPFEKCQGALRESVLSDNGDEIQPPRFEPVGALVRFMFDGHQPPLVAAMQHLGLL